MYFFYKINVFVYISFFFYSFSSQENVLPAFLSTYQELLKSPRVRKCGLDSKSVRKYVFINNNLKKVNIAAFTISIFNLGSNNKLFGLN